MATINFNNIKFLASYGTANQLPSSNKCEFAFVGRSNVGKSSLINKLCNNKNLAKVSSTPGKTTTINFFDAGNSILVDLPGYGYASRSRSEINRWSDLIEGYFTQDRNIGLVVSLIDVRHDPSNEDVNMLNFLLDLGLPFVVVLTKADKLSKQKQNNAVMRLYKTLGIDTRIPVLLTSAEKNTGIQDLRKMIENIVE